MCRGSAEEWYTTGRLGRGGRKDRWCPAHQVDGGDDPLVACDPIGSWRYRSPSVPVRRPPRPSTVCRRPAATPYVAHLQKDIKTERRTTQKPQEDDRANLRNDASALVPSVLRATCTFRLFPLPSAILIQLRALALF